jgi:hypothetical protein
MYRALFILLVVHCSLPRAGAGIDLRKATGLEYSITSPKPGRIVIRIHNSTTTTSEPSIECGTMFTGTRDQGKLMALRSAAVSVAPKASVEMSIPAAALSSREFSQAQDFAFSGDADPALRPLLDYCEAHDDLPAITAQLLVLCAVEDVSFPKWKEFLARQSRPESPTDVRPGEEVVAAIDALGVLRQWYPQRTFALASDPELKLSALRNPLARAKAMQFYGIVLPEAPMPPDLGTLLHTKTGDNCPICRQRALMQPREDGL